MGLVLVIASCSGESSQSTATLPLADQVASPDNSGPADDLAPSQITASTIATPDTPGQCDLADLEFWTSQVVVGDQSADAVIRVRNMGDVWCEPDISASPLIDPAIEPDVWLDPGGWADLVVGQSGQECFNPGLVSLAQLDVSGEAVVVPTAAIAMCGWRLTAFFPNEVAIEPCDQLDVVDVEGFVLVRNISFTSCVLGELIGVEGTAASIGPPSDTGVPAIVDLAPGDVVAFARFVDPTTDCDADPSSGELIFEAAGVVDAPEQVCGTIYEAGAGRPWFGDLNGPLSPFAGDSFELDQVLAALDPFTP